LQHELLVPEQVQRVCDTPLARLLLDGQHGHVEAVLCHTALVVLQVSISWGLAHVLALRVMPALLPASHMDLLCCCARSDAAMDHLTLGYRSITLTLPLTLAGGVTAASS
jgi:hypothetical protein